MRSLFGVFAVLLSLATASFPQQASSVLPAGKKQLTIDDTLREPTGNAGVPQFVEWSPDGRRLSFVRTNSTDGRDELYSLDPATGHGRVLIGAGPMASLLASNAKLGERERENRDRYGIAAYHWAPDSKGLLFDASGQLWFHDLQSGKSTELTGSASPCPPTRNNGTCREPMASDPKFSPDSRYISFIRDHDLFVRPLAAKRNSASADSPAELAPAPTSATAARVGDPERRLTTSSASVWNGEADWVYQEELDVRSNYFWAPDAMHIAYLQMDESAVPEYPIVDWLSRDAGVDRQRYPKAGERNPSVRIGVVDLDGLSKWLSFTTPEETDLYIPRFGWLSPQVVWALVLNRAQNRESLYFIDIESGKSRLILNETDDLYIPMNDLLRFFEGGSRFLWPSWRDGHMHLYLYEYDRENPLSTSARLVRQVTRGDWEVLDLCALDEKSGAVYFTANKDDWRQSNLYRANLDGTGLRRLTSENGVHKPQMPRNAEYFFDSFSTLTMPPRMQLCDANPAAGMAKCSDIWRSRELDETNVLTPQFVDFKAEDGSLLHGVVLLPKSGTMAADGKFPLILNTYGGPHEQLVRDAWRTVSPLDQVMAQRGFAILKVDNRGTGNRGKKFAAASRGTLGTVELKDQLAALDQALAKYPQLDRNRIGCWGWSFGGTLAAYALTHSTRFKAAVAVAPVTDWRLYDSIYTERYLGTPRQNPGGYRNSSILESAPELSGRLLIAHGTGDDNVHVQNSFQLADALISAGKAFDLQLYPGKTHAIGGLAARSHLYHRIVEHFERWLAPPAR
jgi:dipeptidyl-peptidase-4